MEDHFLYKLRNGQLQNNKSHYRSKKIIEHKKDGNISSDSQKHISKLLEKTINFQKITLGYLEKITIFQDKQSEAITQISDTMKELSKLLVQKISNKKTRECNLLSIKSNLYKKNNYKIKSVRKIANEKGLKPTDEKMLFKAIQDMRENNQTWNAISDYLKEKNVSTLTGNGTWSPNLALYFYKKMLSQKSTFDNNTTT